MPPKPQKPASGRGKPSEEAKEDPLQAVVIADDFEIKFAPFTLERPRCLLPLANTPLIEYTLEYIATAGVQEVFIYAGAHVDQVETYINASRWRHSTSPFKSLTFLRCVASCVGDVMRDLDQKHLMAGDFITVTGDVICDFPIDRVLKKHKARREKDKNAIMTMLLQEVESGHYSQTTSTTPVFVIDPTKDRCLHYEEISLTANFGAHIDPETLKCPELDIRQDLIDCRIDICTPDVLSLWSDNFDNQSPRKDFLYGVLKDYELNGKTIHTYIAQTHYAARAGDLLSYDLISRAFKTRSVPSLAVENNILPGMTYNRSRRGPLREKGVIMARPRKVDSGSIIGGGTSIGANSIVQASIIGHRCDIGKGTQIEDSYIWDDATIGSNVKIVKAIIGNEAFVGDNCTIGEGALISFGVKVAHGTNIPAGVKITAVQQEKSDVTNETLVGSKGQGHEHHDEEDNIPGFGAPGLVYQQPDFADSASTLNSEVSSPISSISGSRSQSFATNASDDDTTDRFQHDTVANLLQRMEEGKKADDMLSELMGLRFSGGADETQVRKAVAVALMKHIQNEIEAGLPAANTSRRILTAYRTLIRREHAVQTAEEQVLFLLDIQKELARRNEGARTLLFVAKDLYDMGVFTEDAFLQWWADDRSRKENDMAEVRKPTAQFIEWLENAESESDEEDEDDT